MLDGRDEFDDSEHAWASCDAYHDDDRRAYHPGRGLFTPAFYRMWE